MVLRTISYLVFLFSFVIKFQGDGEQEEEQEEEIPETRIDVEIPRIITNFGRALYFVKLPNFLSVDTRFVLNPLTALIRITNRL